MALPRVAFPLVLQSPSTGSALVGANATITAHVVGGALGSGAAATIYTEETGAGKTASNVITTDNTGRWTQGSSEGYILISGTGLTAVYITREMVTGGAFAVTAERLGPGSVGSTKLEAESVVTNAIKNEAVTDAKVVKGRALVETENSYTAMKSATKTEAEAGFAPSSTRPACVILSIRLAGSNPITLWMTNAAAEYKEVTVIETTETVQIPITFDVDPGRKFKLTGGGTWEIHSYSWKLR
jgi:hypothetical protein